MSEAPSAFIEYLTYQRVNVERWIEEHAWVAGDVEPAADLAQYLYDPLARFNAGAGKRVRPVLACLGCEAVGGAAEQALAAGCAVELFQSAALIHDDIADASTLRRGHPCLHITEGLGLAINVGDTALIQAFEAILADTSLPPSTRLALLSEMLQMERQTLEGQALDLGWARDSRWDISPRDYLHMASRKTARYSASTPLVLGAICGDATPEQIAALRAFGMDAGLAFQIADDLLNLEGSAKDMGKDFRSDISEGKRTLIVTWALEHLEETQAHELRALLAASITDDALLEQAVSYMTACGALEHARSVAHELVESAIDHLDCAELATPAREILISMAHFFVERAS